MAYEEHRKRRIEKQSRSKKRVERTPEKPSAPYVRPHGERFDGARARLEARIGPTRSPNAGKRYANEPIRVDAKPRVKLSAYKGKRKKSNVERRPWKRDERSPRERRGDERSERRAEQRGLPPRVRDERPRHDIARGQERVPRPAPRKPFVPRFSRRSTPRKTKVEPPKAPGTPERVQKLIAAAGLASRREAERWIEEGRVQVNGHTIHLGDQATRKDKVTVNGAPITFPARVYVMLHKPKGYVTTRKDIYGNKTVMELVVSDERLYPVGRLDKDTTGILLLTNDGEFANRIMHPRYEIEKTYVATLDKPFAPQDLKAFASGIHLKEGIVQARVRILSPRRVEVKLHQGYNHVVKRIMKQSGYYVKDLTRTRIGPVALDIPLSAYRSLSDAEVAALLKPQASAKASSYPGK